MTPLKVLQTLFDARDQIHLIHLNTKSYSEHKALDTFYSEWLGLVDTFIETYQGKYGRIDGVCSITISTAQTSRNYLVKLMEFLVVDIESVIDPKVDSDLENIIADMKQLVNHTLYLLTLS